MKRSERLYYLQKISQETNAKPNFPILQPSAPNISGYWEKLTSIIPGLNVSKLDNKSWVLLSKIVGILDWSLIELSDKRINFYSATTQNPSVTSANSKNADMLTSIIRISQLIKSQCVQPGQQLSKEELLGFINKISTDANSISLNTTNQSLTNIIQGSPKDALLRELNNWKNLLNTI